MDGLPDPPLKLSIDGGEVRFDKMTPGVPDLGFVPAYQFRIFTLRDEEAGHVNVRYEDTEHVLRASGHIGYGVHEPFRGNGFAKKACLALKPWLPSVREQFLITVDPDNYPSIRTIEAIGAVFVDEVDVPEGDPHYLRGCFRKKRYLWTP